MMAAKRSTYGDGSVYPIKGGTMFRAKVRINGKEVTRDRATRTQAHQARRELLKLRDTGGRHAVTKHTVATWATTWLQDVATINVRPRTALSMRYHVERITRHIGHLPLARVTPDDVQHVVAALHRDGLAASTINVTRGVMVQLFDLAVQRDLITRNSARLVKPLRVAKPRRRTVTLAECQHLCTAADAHGCGIEVRLGLFLGLRLGEVLGAQWTCVDWTPHTFRVTHALQHLNNRYTLVPLKTEHSHTTVPMPDLLVDALRTHRAHQAQTRLRAGSTWQTFDLICTTAKGIPIAPTTLRQRFRRALHDAGMPRMRFHDLRHSCGSILATMGVLLQLIQAILRHANMTTTVSTYIHIQDDAQIEAAMDQFNRAVRDTTQRNAG
jgi:integrase